MGNGLVDKRGDVVFGEMRTNGFGITVPKDLKDLQWGKSYLQPPKLVILNHV